jgi:hypothetical protein
VILKIIPDLLTRGGRKLKRKNKGIALLLVLMMMLTLIPVLPAPVAEASTGGTTMEKLGFNTGILPEGYKKPDSIEDTPYGKKNVIITPVSELFTFHENLEGNNVIGRLTGHNDNSHTSSIEKTLFNNLDGAGNPQHRHYTSTRAAAGDFDGDGTDEGVAIVALDPGVVNQEDSRFDLLVINPLTGVCDTIQLFYGPTGQGADGEAFDHYIYGDSKLAYKLQNYLSITTGDFDGDYRDEIAVFVPAVKKKGGSRVEVYDYNGSSWQRTHSLPSTSWDDAVVNMVDLLAADINGDGIEDLCYSENLYNRALEDWYQPTGNFTISNSYINIRYGAKTSALGTGERILCKISDDEEAMVTRLALDFGDIDHDGKSELVAAGQKGRDENTRWFAMYKYNHGTNKLQMVEDTLITLGSFDVNGQNYGFFSTAGCMANLACVKSVGGKEEIYCDSVLYEYTPGSGFKVKKRFEGSSFTSGDFANGASGAWWGAAGIKWTDVKSDGGNYYFHEWGAQAADFDGDGVETVYLQQHFWKDVYVDRLSTIYNEKNGDSLVLDHPYYRQTEINLLQTENGTEVTEGSNTFTHVLPALSSRFLGIGDHNCSFAAPNTDDDSIRLTYKRYYFTYSNPIVMAVLASPPYFSDLGHLEGGDTYIYCSATSFGKTAGSGGSTTQTNTVSVGGTVGFEHEWSVFDVKVASIEIEAAFQQDWTWETEQASSKEYSVTYTTFGGQDSVVLYSIPTDVFVYDAWTPNEDGTGWTMSEMVIQLPYQPVTSVMEVSAYDEIAKQYPNTLAEVRGEILKHTMGQPATYPQTTAGLSDVLTGSEWSGVSGGAGAAITQGIDITTENTETTSYNNSWNLTVGGTILDAKASVSVGGEAGGGESVTNMEGTTFETTVVNMPQEGRDAGYGYNWKLLKHSYDGVQSFPVITYLVSDVRQPSALSANMTAEGISTGEIELTWEESKNLTGETDETAAWYSIYRYYDSSINPGYREIARIPSISSSNYTYNESTGEYTATEGGYVFTYDETTGAYSYINGLLSPYTLYQYKLQVTSNQAPYQSVFSDACEARTLSDVATVSIEGPESITVYPDDENAIMAVNVSTRLEPGYKLGGEQLYQWQKRAKSTRGVDGRWVVSNWGDIYGAKGTTIIIANPKESDALEYRFIAEIPISPETGGGTQWIGAISKVADLAFTKRTPVLTVTAANAEGDSPAVNLRSSVDKVSGKADPTGTVFFTMTNDGSFNKTVSAAVDNSGIAAVNNIPLPAEGVYEISAVYSGDTVYEGVKTSIEHVALSAGTVDFHYIEMDSSIEYGDTFVPKLFKYVSGGLKQEVAGVSFSVQNNTGWVEGSTVTARGTGSYILVAGYTVDGIDKTVSKGFTVSPKAVTVTAPSMTAEKGAASLPGIDTLDISPDLVLEDTAESLGLSVQCWDSKNQPVTFDDHTPAGVYTTIVAADPGKAAARSNYKFTFLGGTYAVRGGKFAVKLSSSGSGSIEVTNPPVSEEIIDDVGYYRDGTEITVTAAPAPGHSVVNWQVNDQTVDPNLLSNRDVLIWKLEGTALNVKAIFGQDKTYLTLAAEHGKITNNTYVQSGDVVTAGAEIVFTAEADAGWHFKEWRQIKSGTTTAFGGSPLAFTMPNVSCTLIAVFERDSYKLNLGEHLTAMAGGEAVISGGMVKGDTMVTVSAAPGYTVCKWFVNGVEDSSGPAPESYSFSMAKDTEITAETERQAFTVEFNLEQGAGNITATADGAEFTSGDRVGGGAEIVIAVEPEKNYTFDSWKIEGDGAANCSTLGTQLFCPALNGNLRATAELVAPLTVTVTAGKNGSVAAEINGEKASIDGTALLVPYRADLTLLAKPDIGFMVESWVINGEKKYASSKTWEIKSVTGDLSVQVNFTSIAFYEVFYSVEEDSVTGAAGYGHLVAEADGVSFSSGDELGGGSRLVFTAAPDPGYMAGWIVKIRGEEQEEYGDVAGNVLVIPGLSGMTEVWVAFTKAILYAIDIVDPENGMINGEYTPDDYDDSDTDKHEVCKGTRAVFTVRPDKGYDVVSVSVNGEPVSEDCTRNSDGSWTYIVERVDEDLEVSAEIRVEVPNIKTYSITVSQVSGGNAGASHDTASPGEQVHINAEAAKDYTFAGWTIIAETEGIAVEIDDKTTENTYFIMPASNVTVCPSFSYSGGGGGSSSGSSTPTTPTSKADVTGISAVTTLPVNINTNAGSATLDLGTLAGDKLFGEGTAVITVPSIPGVDTYTLGISADSLSGSQGEGLLTFATGTGNITIPDNMLAGIPGTEGSSAGITIAQGDKSGLPDEVKATVGDRPIVQLTLTLDGTQTDWNNPDALVTVSIPYTPIAEELADPEHIVVWYIDGSGNVVSVPNGRYDPATGTVTFTTTHFSCYAVAYVHKTFSDLSSVEWARKSIEIMASKGIINGTGANTYLPAANITRADYLVLLIKTLGLTADANSNFDDVEAGAYYYEALGSAKKLGIAAGSGNNRFNPRGNISRQDMMVLTARALEKIKRLEAVDNNAVLDKFSDKEDISGYAVKSLATLVKEGLVAGSGDKLYPRAQTTRAEAAAFLHRIYNTY